MKKLVCLLLLFVITFSFAVAENIDLSSMSNEELEALKNRIDEELQNRNGNSGLIKFAADFTLYSSKTFGTIYLTGYETKNYNGKTYLIIYCQFKNTLKETAHIALHSLRAYQNGIELDDDINSFTIPSKVREGLTLISGIYSPSIRPGYSYDFQRVYALDDYSPVQIEKGTDPYYNDTVNIYTIEFD